SSPGPSISATTFSGSGKQCPPPCGSRGAQAARARSRRPGPHPHLHPPRDRRKVTHRPALYVAFVLSGVAGLAFGVRWHRCPALFVGAGAFAQLLVLSVSLGGLAVGALAASARPREVARPLVGYAVLEGVLGGFGLPFHPLCLFVTGLGYDTLF